MSATDPRHAALRFITGILLWLACALLWLSVLSFSAADPPSTTVWPLNAEIANWCGVVGARLAHALFYYFGAGAYAVAALATAWVASRWYGAPMRDFALRVLGAALICTAISTAASMLFAESAGWLVTGAGGVLGRVLAPLMLAQLHSTGAAVVLAAAILVGLLLTADELVIRAAQSLFGIGRTHGAEWLRQGGAALGNASASLASGVAQVSGRLVTAGGGWFEGRPAAKRERPVAVTSRGAGVVADPGEDDEAADADDEYEYEYVYEDEPEDEADEEEYEEDEEEYEEGDEAEEEEDEEVPEDAVDPNADRVARAGAAPVRTTPTPSAKPRQAELFETRRSMGDYDPPDVKLLEVPEPVDRAAVTVLCREKARTLQQTLSEFKFDVEVIGIETGPVITMFELRLAPGIKVSQIASLSNDMARAMKAPAVRVVAPLPGRNTIGIEVPNIDKEKVRIRELMQHERSVVDNAKIPLFLGKDASGQPLITDLTRMPHLLIAGSTGSGKSVCVTSIIMSILLTRSPDEVNLILIDPKVVELTMFKDVPHLISPIVTEMSKGEGILDWAVNKMDERYALLAEAGVKDIVSYNKLGEAGLRERMHIEDDEELTKIPIRLPYVVIVVDELADMMMTSAKEVEFYLCRLAQKSRAVGIHLIVSTQRPQANVVTGLIKSNMPSRICFRVASRLDSRIVLDQNGGEVLMGQGDLLFLPPGQSKLVRAQGTFVSDDELRAVVKHARGQGEPTYHPELMRMPKAGGEGSGERDELFDQAVEYIIDSGRGSVSLLQRRLGIGYSRASRLIDQMYDAGIVGEYKGSQAREVILSREDWEAVRADRDADDDYE